jgi:hypothetical protein
MLIIGIIIFAGLLLALSVNPSSMNLQDASLTVTLALPAAASSTVTSATGVDTGVSTAASYQPAEVEYQLTNATTVTYSLISSASSNMSSPTTLISGVLVQTGAGGVGAASNSARYRLPSNAGRYIGFTATTSASTGNCSAASAILQPLF